MCRGHGREEGVHVQVMQCLGDEDGPSPVHRSLRQAYSLGISSGYSSLNDHLK